MSKLSGVLPDLDKTPSIKYPPPKAHMWLVGLIQSDQILTPAGRTLLSTSAEILST